MDTYLAVASKRDERRYADRSIPPDLERRILDAGRLSGSSTNKQPWRFVVVETRETVDRLAEQVYAPANVHGAALVIAVVATTGRSGFDHGRAAQNMMLVAWNESVASRPNGIRDPEGAAATLALEGDERAAIVLGFGYPARPRDPHARTAEQWSGRANRRQLEELVRRV